MPNPPPLPNITPAQLPVVVLDYHNEGATNVITTQQPDGNYSVQAIFASTTPAPATSIPVKLPDYAQNVLGPQQGVPWGQAGIMPQYNGYLGIVPNTFCVFHGLQGMPGGVTSAAYYECKLSNDDDGRTPPPFPDPDHQGDTSLHDAIGALDAFIDAYAVLPEDQSETTTPKHGLPDFGADLGLNLGDIGVAFWRQSASGSPLRCFYIYGDKGPAVKLGEGSVKMLETLGVPGADQGDGIEATDIQQMGKGIIHIGFVGSGASYIIAGSNPPQTTLDADGVIDLGIRLFAFFTSQPQS